MIELVIKIPEELYRAYKNRPPMLGDAGMDMIAQAIANGTPLPKGHGRLKDVDWIDDNCEGHYSDKDGSWCYAWKDINNAPTIIESEV